MTWQHLQQLRSAARARISQRLDALQPRGGEGCTVNGNLISLEPLRRPQRPEPEEPRTNLSVLITGTEVRTIGGETEVIPIMSGPNYVRDISINSNAHFTDWEGWIISSSGEGGTQHRTVSYELQLVPYRFPVTIKFQYIDNHYRPHFEEEVDIDRAGPVRYSPKHPGLNEAFYIWMPRIARRGSTGPTAGIVVTDLPPQS